MFDELQDLPKDQLIMFSIISLVFILGILIIYIQYIKNLQDTLKSIREVNRLMQPQKVWVLLISMVNILLAVPEVNSLIANKEMNTTLRIVLTITSFAISSFVLVWHYMIVDKLSKSIENELNSRNIITDPRPTYKQGLYMIAFQTLAVICGNIPFLGGLASIGSIVSFIYWIIYWSKTREYKNNLKALPSHPEESSVF